MTTSRRTHPAAPRASLLSLSIAVALLGACGGGGDSSTQVDEAPDEGLTPADVLVISAASNRPQPGQTLLAIDPDQPGSPRWSITLSDTDTFARPVRYRLRASNGQQLVHAEPMSTAYYIKGRQLFQISLRKSDTIVPRRVSSLDTACAVYGREFGLGPGDGWIEINEAGPDGRCDEIADNREVYARFNAASSEAPVHLPFGVHLLSGLSTERFAKPLFFLAHDTRGAQPKLVLYTPDLTPAGDVAGGADVTVFRAPSTAIHGDVNHLFASVDGTLRRLSWSSSGVTLSPSLHGFGPGIFSGLHDGEAFYFLHGLDVMRIRGNEAPARLATLDGASGPQASLLHSTPTRLLIVQSTSYVGSGTTSSRMFSLYKQGGPLTPVAVGSALWIQGVAGEDVFYADAPIANQNPSLTRWRELNRVRSDGTGRLTIASLVEDSMQVIRPRSYPQIVRPPIEGLLWCERPGPYDNCLNGSLKLFNAGTGTTTHLGRFSHTDSYNIWDPMGWTPIPHYLDAPIALRTTGSLLGSTTVEHEFYLAQPGVPNSLVRLAGPAPAPLVPSPSLPPPSATPSPAPAPAPAPAPPPPVPTPSPSAPTPAPAPPGVGG